MTILELRNKRNKLLHDAQSILLADTVTAEDRTKANSMIAEADVAEADYTSLEKIAAESRSAQAVPRGEIATDKMSADERNAKHKAAVLRYMRQGVQGLTAEDRTFVNTENRALITSGTAGDLIPQGFLPTLIEAQKSYGQILDIVTKKQTDTGAPMKVGLVNDTGNQISVIGENTAVSELDPTFTGFLSSTDELTSSVILVSMAELQDSAFDLNAWIKTAFAKRWYRGLSAMVTNGSSSGNIQALTAATIGSTTTSGVAISYSDLAAHFTALDPDYIQNSSWTMNSTTRGYLIGVKDGYGRPLFNDSPNSDAFSKLFGRPVVLNQELPNIAVGNVAVQFGDFAQGYMLRTAGDLSVLRLTERYAELGMIGFIGYGRAGGNLTDAGSHPILSLKQAAS